MGWPVWTLPGLSKSRGVASLDEAAAGIEGELGRGYHGPEWRNWFGRSETHLAALLVDSPALHVLSGRNRPGGHLCTSQALYVADHGASGAACGWSGLREAGRRRRLESPSCVHEIADPQPDALATHH